QVEAVSFGNPSLRPETSNTFTAGVVLTPDFLPNVTVSADFWRISIDRFISPTPVADQERQCQLFLDANGDNAALVPTFATIGQTSTPNACGFVSRTQDGELIFNLPEINQPGTLRTSGVDLQVSVTHDVADLLGESGDWGALDLNVA